MICPFDSETALSEITEVNTEPEISRLVSEFKGTLSTEQTSVFNAIDDLLIQQVTLVQHDTIRKLHCPTCKIRRTGCP